MANNAEFSLCHELIFFNKSRQKCLLKLFERALYVTINGNTEMYIFLDDITGCKITQNPTFKLSSNDNQVANNGSNGTRSFLHIYSYPLVDRRFSEIRRRRRILIFYCNKSDNSEENLEVLQEWRQAILAKQKLLCHTADIPHDISKRKKLLILVNPVSGNGKAARLFNNHVVHMINEADIPYEVILTEKHRHAYEIAKYLNKNDWSGVLTVSGDGLLYEVINGLMNREDYSDAITLPVGIIAAGSGNGLACSLNYYAGEPYVLDLTFHSTFTFLKQRTVPMDLVLVQTPTQSLYSFLAVTHGIVADCDLESEKYRKWGNMRYTIVALQKIMRLRIYRYRFSYLPVIEYESAVTPVRKVPKKIRSFSLVDKCAAKVEKTKRNSEGIIQLSMENDEFVEEEKTSGRDADVKLKLDGLEVENKIEKQTSDEAQHLASNTGENTPTVSSDPDDPGLSARIMTADGSDEGSSEKFASSRDSEATDGVVHENITAELSSNDALSSLLVPLDQPVPDTWTVVEDEFIGVVLSHQSMLSPDLLISPDCRLNNGFIQVTLINKDLSRMRLIKLMGLMKDGSHIDAPDLVMTKVLAFRLEPLDHDGVIMVDGEQYPPDTIQGQVLPGIARVMTISPQ